MSIVHKSTLIYGYQISNIKGFSFFDSKYELKEHSIIELDFH